MTNTIKKKRVLVLVDFKYRDLPGMALLKVLLEQRGQYEVVLAHHVPSLGDRLYLRKVKPHLVVFPRFVNEEHAARAYRLKEYGIGVAVVPAEGMHFTTEGRLQMAGKFTDLTPVDLFFLWNRGIYDLVRKYETIPAERCVLGGVPRFDFYHPRYRSLLMRREAFCEKYDLDPKRPTITWATNFGWPVYAGNTEAIARINRQYQSDGVAVNPLFADVREIIKRDVESRAVLSDAVLGLARAFPEANWVIKLHPSEEPAFYLAKVASAGATNVRIIAREYIWNVLNATDVHLHRSCTTAVEGWLLGKPTLDLQLAPNEWYFEEALAPGSHVVASRDECADVIRHYLNGGSIPHEQLLARPGIIEWFAGATDGQSGNRHADALHAWLQDCRSQPTVSRWHQEHMSFELTGLIKPLLGLQPYHSLRLWLKGGHQDVREKYFSPEDVRIWVRNIQRVLNGAA